MKIFPHTCVGGGDVQLSSDRQSVKLSWLIVGSVPVFPEDVRDVTY